MAARVLEYFKKQKVRAYDRQVVLSRLPFELRSKILRHLYLPTIQVRCRDVARQAVLPCGLPNVHRVYMPSDE